MSERVDLGPVEIAVIDLPGNRFSEEIADALAEVVANGTVSILDLVLVAKDDQGVVSGLELSDMEPDDVAPFERVDGDVGGLLSDEDLATAGGLLTPGSRAALVVWENTWARGLVGAIRRAGGELVAHDRIDAATVAAAMAETDD